MSKNKKKIFKATSQTKLAQCWAEGKEADLKKQNALLQIRNGTITAITQSYDWSRGGWIQNAPITIAFTNDDGERVVYNYTGQDLATTYLGYQRPHKWNNGQPRLPHLTYAQIGKGTVIDGISTSLIYKLVEDGRATKILLPPA
tara:strand:- start:458 stop:889 length:432 start_codon:yes stop_codon:yes gene_type:complete